MFVFREPLPTISTVRKAVEVVRKVAKFLTKGVEKIKKAVTVVASKCLQQINLYFDYFLLYFIKYTPNKMNVPHSTC
jgi:hypothetical protein